MENKKIKGMAISEKFEEDSGITIEIDTDNIIDYGKGRLYGRGKQELLIVKVKNIRLFVWIKVSNLDKETKKELLKKRDENIYCPYPTRGIFAVTFTKKG